MNTIARIVTKLWPPVGETTQATGLSAPLNELDGLRSLAIFALFLSILPSTGLEVADAIRGGLAFGYDLLLVIYAYGLTRILMFEHRRSGQLALRNYLMRRLLVLVPVSFILIAFLLVWGFWTSGSSIMADAIGILTFTQNLHIAMTGAPEFAPIAHLELLSALFQYALVLPVLASIAVGSSRVFGLVALAWLLLSIAFSAILILDGSPATRMLALSPFRPEAVLTGAAMAVFEVRLWKLRHRALVALGILVVAVLGIVTFRIGGPAGWQDLARMASNTVLSGLILAIVLMWRPATRLVSWTPLVWTGRMWLSLFILMWPAILVPRHLVDALELEGGIGWAVTVGLAAISSVLVSAILWYALGRRIHKLRRHYEFIEGRPLRL
jgi:peptidoglycan/LPS O-acetylase OafA/YrhL